MSESPGGIVRAADRLEPSSEVLSRTPTGDATKPPHGLLRELRRQAPFLGFLVSLLWLGNVLALAYFSGGLNKEDAATLGVAWAVGHVFIWTAAAVAARDSLLKGRAREWFRVLCIGLILLPFESLACYHGIPRVAQWSMGVHVAELQATVPKYGVPIADWAEDPTGRPSGKFLVIDEDKGCVDEEAYLALPLDLRARWPEEVGTVVRVKEVGWYPFPSVDVIVIDGKRRTVLRRWRFSDMTWQADPNVSYRTKQVIRRLRDLAEKGPDAAPSTDSP